mmetsp:Transcript_103053/g.210122  ORF Transcript_103053/g.210122 Transcript_103053/m.210122 type:complete len:612 (-) Transcript_103053:77-1912(-)
MQRGYEGKASVQAGGVAGLSRSASIRFFLRTNREFLFCVVRHQYTHTHTHTQTKEEEEAPVHGDPSAVSVMQPTTTIPVVVVESHQHVLEHIHDVLRMKKLFDRNWSMLHFDAHPDMACTKSAPAVACFKPRGRYSCSVRGSNHHRGVGNDGNIGNDERATTGDEGSNDGGRTLYELLDLTPSGIAEWILPLVLAAKLSKIEWVKPGFSTQISEGRYRFSVGVERDPDNNNNNGDDEEARSYLDISENARVKVDFHHPYYLDDQSVVSSSELLLKQELELTVSELRSLPAEEEQHKSQEPAPGPTGDGEERRSGATKQNRRLWALDICLDYFACHNPYLFDLENTSPSATRAFLDLMEGSIFNNSTNNSTSTSNQNNALDADNNQPVLAVDYQREITRFYGLLKQILFDNCGTQNKKRPLGGGRPRTTTGAAGVASYFETAERAEELVRKLVVEINAYDNDNDDKGSGGGGSLLSMITEAIPNWGMPHARSTGAATDREIRESLRSVESRVRRHIGESGSPPFLVTVCRSALDGFCPRSVAEVLQERVLAVLRRTICRRSPAAAGDAPPGGSSSPPRLLLVRDYGEWEGSVVPRRARETPGVPHRTAVPLP